MFRVTRLTTGFQQLKSIQNGLAVLIEALKSKYYLQLLSKLYKSKLLSKILLLFENDFRIDQ